MHRRRPARGVCDVGNRARGVHRIGSVQGELAVVAIDLLIYSTGQITASIIVQHSNQRDWAHTDDRSIADQAIATVQDRVRTVLFTLRGGPREQYGQNCKSDLYKPIGFHTCCLSFPLYNLPAGAWKS